MTHQEFSRKGGQSKSPKKREAVVRNLLKAVAARKLKAKLAHRDDLAKETKTTTS